MDTMEWLTALAPAIGELIRIAVEAVSELTGELPPSELDIPSETEKEQEK